MRDLGVAVVVTGAIQGLNIATGILAARLLGPEGRGELAAIVLWVGLLAELGQLGLYDALMYRVATRAATPRQIVAALGVLIVVICGALFVIGWAVLPLVLYDESAHVMALAGLYMLGYLPGYFGSFFYGAVFQGALQLGTWNLLRVLVPAGYCAAILAAWALAPPSVAGFAAANALAHLAVAGLGLALIARRGWLAFRPEGRVLAGLLGYGLRVYVGDLLQAVRTRLDQALVSLWLPAADLGLYVVALTLANAPVILGNTIAGVAFPKVSGAETVEVKREVFGRYLRVAAVMAAAVVAALEIVDDWLIPTLFGAAFAPAVPVCDVLLLGLLPYTVKLMYMAGLKAWDLPLLVGRAELFGLVAAAAALVALLPPYGLMGAAWGLVIAHVAALAAMAWLFHRATATPLFDMLRPSARDLEILVALWRTVRR